MHTRPFSGRIDREREWPDVHSSALDNEILLAQSGKNCLWANPESGDAISSELDIDDLLLVSKNLDFFYVGDQEQFASQQFGRLIELRV